MKTDLLPSLIVLLSFLLAGCADPKGDNTDGIYPPSDTAPAPTPGTVPSYPPGVTQPGGGSGGNTFVPVIDSSEYPNITGGTFKVIRVAVHSNSWIGTFSGIVAEGSDIYELWTGPASSGSTSYRLVKTSETGASSTYCSWVGDGFTYRGIGYDAEKLFFRKNLSSLIFQQFNPSTCLAEGILSFSSQTDDAGFSLVAWGDMFQAIGGKLLVPFQTSSANKLKLFNPTLLKYTDYALEQNLGGEQLRLNTSFVVQNNIIWTANSCKLTYNTICLWKMDLAAAKMTYAFLPKGSFPDMGPPDYYSKVFILKGQTSTELRYVVVKSQEVRIYVLDISKF